MQPGRDVNRAAIALFTARLHHPSQTSHQAVLNALIFQLDVAMERFVIFVFSSFSCAPHEAHNIVMDSVVTSVG